MNKVYQITEAGKNELKDELETLKGRRGEIAEKIAEARDYGDLSENAEYDAAREEQGMLKPVLQRSKIYYRMRLLLRVE